MAKEKKVCIKDIDLLNKLGGIEVVRAAIADYERVAIVIKRFGGIDRARQVIAAKENLDNCLEDFKFALRNSKEEKREKDPQFRIPGTS